MMMLHIDHKTNRVQTFTQMKTALVKVVGQQIHFCVLERLFLACWSLIVLMMLMILEFK